VIGRYREIYRRQGAPAFCAAALVMRLPISMYPLGIVLIVSAREGRYAFAAFLSACFLCGYALGAPMIAALIDRHGQRRVLLPVTAVHAAGVTTLAILLHTDAPDELLVLPTVVFGLSFMSVPSLVRARWAFLVGAGPELTTALAAESVLDELMFVSGPAIATVLATSADPVAVLYVCAALRVGGGIWLASLRGTEPRLHPIDGTVRVSALRTRGIASIVLAIIAIGAAVASAEVAIVAFCGQHGVRSITGLVLGTLAVGSCAGGVVYGAIRWRADAQRRFQQQAMLLAALSVGLLAAASVRSLTVAAFVLGLGVAPIFITAFGLIQQRVPPQALNEGMAWISAGVNLGAGIGAALVGEIVDRHGARAGFFVAVACAASGAALALTAGRKGPPPTASAAAAIGSGAQPRKDVDPTSVSSGSRTDACRS
jgi:MFS family permease